MTDPARPDLLQAEYDAACERIGDLQAEIESAGARCAELEWIAKSCAETTSRAKAIHAPEDAHIEALCEQIGYGAVMNAAARLWFLKDPIGSLAIGPCVSQAKKALASDGSAVADVIAAAKEMRNFKIEGKTRRSETSIDFGLWNKFCNALDRLDGR